jgi:1-acyl-sn-glycerol-3-phosphate acyltransferase
MDERKVRAYSSYSRDALIPPAAGEGVAWLGRAPWAKASPPYRLLRFSLKSVGWIFGLRVRGYGLDRLASSGPRILIGAPHRRYYEAFALGIAMPAQPRVWWLGLGPFIVGRGRIRAGMLRRLGGLLPVWRGSSGIETHLAAATAVFAAGAHYAVMPEGGTSGPVDRFAEFRPGAAVIGMRTGVPVVPVVFRFRNRRIGLPRVEIIGLADTWVVQPGDTPPTPGSREELTLAAEWSRAISERMESVWRDGVGSAA